MSATAQDIAIPYAFCELCSSESENPVNNETLGGGTGVAAEEQKQEKQRAMCECLNCNVPMCAKCRAKHAQNPRLATHKIVNYQ